MSEFYTYLRTGYQVHALASAMREADEPDSDPAAILPAEEQYARQLVQLLNAQGWEIVRAPSE